MCLNLEHVSRAACGTLQHFTRHIAPSAGGLHILEQSLWTAVPAYVRKLSDAVRATCGRELPLDATPVKFASWMGGDRDGNPNVTAKARPTPAGAADMHCRRRCSVFRSVRHAHSCSLSRVQTQLRAQFNVSS